MVVNPADRPDDRRWDWTAIRAGGALALVFAIPLWFAASWAVDSRDNRVLGLVFSVGALVAFMVGAACAAWVQRLQLPLGHGIVTSVGTYLAVQVVVTAYRLVNGDSVNIFNVMFFVTLAAGAGLFGGLIGQRLRSLGFVPSHERRIDGLDGLGGHGREESS